VEFSQSKQTPATLPSPSFARFSNSLPLFAVSKRQATAPNNLRHGSIPPIRTSSTQIHPSETFAPTHPESLARKARYTSANRSRPNARYHTLSPAHRHHPRPAALPPREPSPAMFSAMTRTSPRASPRSSSNPSSTSPPPHLNLRAKTTSPNPPPRSSKLSSTAPLLFLTSIRATITSSPKRSATFRPSPSSPAKTSTTPQRPPPNSWPHSSPPCPSPPTAPPPPRSTYSKAPPSPVPSASTTAPPTPQPASPSCAGTNPAMVQLPYQAPRRSLRLHAYRRPGPLPHHRPPRRRVPPQDLPRALRSHRQPHLRRKRLLLLQHPLLPRYLLW